MIIGLASLSNGVSLYWIAGPPVVIQTLLTPCYTRTIRPFLLGFLIIVKTLKPFQLGAHLDASKNYRVNKNANIVSRNSGQEMRQRIGKRGLRTVDLSLNGQQLRCYVHVLVALYHVQEGIGLSQSVLHKDGNYANNCADNLQWYDPQEGKVCRGCGRPLQESPIADWEDQLRAQDV